MKKKIKIKCILIKKIEEFKEENKENEIHLKF